MNKISNAPAISQSLMDLSQKLIRNGLIAEQLSEVCTGFSSFCSTLKFDDMANPEKLRQFREELLRLSQALTAAAAHCGDASDFTAPVAREISIALSELSEFPTC